jgi:hypothetical protein
MAAITTANGTEQTKYAAGGIDNMVGKLWHNPVHMAYDEYTLPATDTAAAGFVISMGRLPKHAIVIGFQWTATAMGAAMTADVAIGGVAATTAEAFTDMTAATTQFVGSTGVFPYTPLTAESQITVTTAAQAFAPSATVSLTTLYVMDK